MTALVGTWVWPSISHSPERSVLSVMIVRPFPGLDREGLLGTWLWKPRWEDSADLLLCWWDSAAQASGGGRYLPMCDAGGSRAPGCFTSPKRSRWFLLGCWPLPITPVRFRLVQGTAGIVQHSTHTYSLEGTCKPVNSHMYVHSTLVYM